MADAALLQGIDPARVSAWLAANGRAANTPTYPSIESVVRHQTERTEEVRREGGVALPLATGAGWCTWHAMPAGELVRVLAEELGPF